VRGIGETEGLKRAGSGPTLAGGFDEWKIQPVSNAWALCAEDPSVLGLDATVFPTVYTR